jgi:hypothetical protein
MPLPYTFQIAFPGGQRATLCALTKAQADAMERALTTLRAEYMIIGPRAPAAQIRPIEKPDWTPEQGGRHNQTLQLEATGAYLWLRSSG